VWVDDTLKLLFRQGLNSDLQSELACRDEDKTLDQFIDLAIRIDNLIRSRRSYRPTCSSSQMSQPSDPTEPMQVGRTHLSTEERERRLRNHLCLYCGQAGHLRADCPTRPSQAHNRRVSLLISAISTNRCMELSIKLTCQSKTITTQALLDSGAAGNFIDEGLVRQYKIPLTLCESG